MGFYALLVLIMVWALDVMIEGGLALLWKDEVDIQLQTLDRLHIDVAILDPVTKEEKWRLTGFYGEAWRDFHHRRWECLKMLKRRRSLSWICTRETVPKIMIMCYLSII